MRRRGRADAVSQAALSPVGRVDNVWGDRNLFCSCVPLSAYAEAEAGDGAA